jgi:hypothetical protein
MFVVSLDPHRIAVSAKRERVAAIGGKEKREAKQ